MMEGCEEGRNELEVQSEGDAVDVDVAQIHGVVPELALFLLVDAEVVCPDLPVLVVLGGHGKGER